MFLEPKPSKPYQLPPLNRMPKEKIPTVQQRAAPGQVYVTLRDLIGCQYDARGFSFMPKYSVQSILSGRHASRLRGRGLDFEEVRTYVQGDDIRNIDWRVTARTGQTHTKVFTEEKERPVLLIVDQSSSMFFGSQVFLKSVIAAQFAALAAWRVLSVDDRVGGIIYDDENLEYVAPKRDRRAVQRLLSIIETKNNALSAMDRTNPEVHPLNQSLYQANRTATHDFLIIVISDFRRADKDTFKQLISLTRHNDVIAALVMDPLEQELPGREVVLTDGVYQTSLKGSGGVSKKYAKQKLDQRQWLADQLKKYAIPLIPLHTGEPAVDQMRRQNRLRLQERRRR